MNDLNTADAAVTFGVRRSVLGSLVDVDGTDFNLRGGVGGVYLSSERLVIGCVLRGLGGGEEMGKVGMVEMVDMVGMRWE